jgi:hypothetical protein
MEELKPQLINMNLQENKNTMKNLIATLLLSFISMGAFAQAAFLDKPEDFDPSKSTKIMVNLKLTKNELGIVEIAQTEDIYLWIWKPKEHPKGHPLENGIGGTAWKNSNPALKMTKESEGVYSFTFTPTVFFECDAATVYKEDFHFLLKPLDGGGYGDPDKKTEDLEILVDPPTGPVVKIKSLPVGKGDKKDTLISSQLDVFSLVYNNTVEDKISMQNATDLYIYAVATDENNVTYKISTNAKKVADFPQLKMRTKGDGVFQSSFIPEKFFNIPAGVKIMKMEFDIVKPNLSNTDDALDEKLIYYMNSGGC